MFIATDCRQYSYTKIAVPIKLLKFPSDYDGNVCYPDIIGDNFSQEQCYIGTQKIEEIKIIRLKEADYEQDQTAVWQLEMIVCGGKTEEEINSLLDEICDEFSLSFIRCFKFFQDSGFDGFFYDRFRLERKYAYEDKVFSDNAINMYCGLIKTKTKYTIEHNVFKLSEKSSLNNNYKDTLTDAFLKALRCKDKISRYILLYYLFEIMYETDEYQMLKEKYKLTYGREQCKKDRNIILFRYLQQEFNLSEYSSFGKSVKLDADTLKAIIKTRNDLTHRGEQSKISSLMYNHLIPILQEVIRKI